MAFLTKKEMAMINTVNASLTLTKPERAQAVAQIKYNARLRSDGYRKPVKVFLSVLSNIKNNAIAADNK